MNRTASALLTAAIGAATLVAVPAPTNAAGSGVVPNQFRCISIGVCRSTNGYDSRYPTSCTMESPAGRYPYSSRLCSYWVK